MHSSSPSTEGIRLLTAGADPGFAKGVGTDHGERGAQPITGAWGRSPSEVQGYSPCRGSAGRSPVEAESFLSIFVPDVGNQLKPIK